MRWLKISLAFLAAAMSAAGREVMVARVEGPIGPATGQYMVEAIAKAESRGCECVVIELDTPGGLDDSMRMIVKKIMGSKIPVVVYVAPAGSRAASAGAFITIAAHVAAMAPATSIGAAHPVALGGAAMDTNMSNKVSNDAAAYIRSIAEKRGHNIEWANSAVKESVALSETEALTNKVIDVIATSVGDLLDKIDGREVTVGEGAVTLRTKGAEIVRFDMNWRDRLLATISNPNVAYILFIIGLLGLYFEFSNPGAILPGVAGAISLILAFFAFQTLSVNYAGVLLIILAVILFIVDVKAPTHGVLTVGGLVAMFIGSVMLFKSPDPALRVSMQVIIPVVLITAAFFILGMVLSVRSMMRRPSSGSEALVGREGEARTPVGPKGGKVFVAGAHWSAVSGKEIAEGEKVRIVKVRKDGMVLEVEAIR